MDFGSLFAGSNLRGSALLRHVMDHVKESPQDFDMHHWIRASHDLDGEGACGTVGCIAGWTALCTSKSTTVQEWVDRGIGPALGMATRDLNISNTEAAELFKPGMWPSDLAMRLLAATKKWRYATTKDEILAAKCEAMKVTIDRVNLFIEEKLAKDPNW